MHLSEVGSTQLLLVLSYFNASIATTHGPALPLLIDAACNTTTTGLKLIIRQYLTLFSHVTVLARNDHTHCVSLSRTLRVYKTFVLERPSTVKQIQKSEES